VLLFGADLAEEEKCKPFPLLLIFFMQYSTIMLLAFHNLKVNVICEAQEGKREREGGGEREAGREGGRPGRETWTDRQRETEGEGERDTACWSLQPSIGNAT
jgi:hypothetical protein